MALNSGKQTNQILRNDDEVCIPYLSCIVLAVRMSMKKTWGKDQEVKENQNKITILYNYWNCMAKRTKKNDCVFKKILTPLY